MSKYLYNTIMAVTLAGALLITGCREKATKGTVSGGTISGFTTCVADTIIKLFNDSTDSPTATIHLSIQYSQNNNKLNDSILKSGILVPDYLALTDIKDTQSAIKEFIKAYAADYKQDVMDMYRQTGTSDMLDWKYTVETSTTKGARDFVCYVSRITMFQGGTDEVTQTIARIFNPKTGEQQHLEDIFVPGSEKQLNDIICQGLQDIFGASNIEGLREEGILVATEPYAPENFIVNDNSITFIYQAGEIASMDKGEILLNIPNTIISNITWKK